MNLVRKSFKLVSKKFNLVPKSFNLVPKNLNLVPKKMNLVRKSFKLVSKKFNLVPKRFNLVSKNFNLVPKNHVFSHIYPPNEFFLKEIRTWDQSKFSSSSFFIWCKSNKLWGRERGGGSRFPCVKAMLETFSTGRVAFKTPRNINHRVSLRKQPTALTRWLFPQKTSTADFRENSKPGSDYRCYRCRVWVDCNCKLHGIRSRRLVYKEVVEARPNYKKSYLWWFGNPAYGDSTESKRIEKDEDRVSPRLVWGKGEKEQCDLVCVARL